MQQNNKPKIAIVYDRVNTSFGGAEIVIKAISQIYPNSPVYTSVYNQKKAQWANNITIIPSFLQKIPFFTDKHQYLLPLMPLAFESFDFSTFDLIISITSAEAKGVLTKPNQKHICYMLTPTRYIYSHKETYLKSKWYLNLPIIKGIIKLVLDYIKLWDQSASIRPDSIIPISNLVAKRVRKYYNRKPNKVVYPPVNVAMSDTEINKIPFFDDTQKFFLSVSRLVDYKRVDLSIKACLLLKKPLVIVGTGESKYKLHELAKENICIKKIDESIEEFLQRATNEKKLTLFTGKLSQKDVYKLFKNCDALLMPGEEDFGITALEAGIFGKAVIVFYRSGVSEILKDAIHSIHLKKETVPEMVYALGKLDTINFNKEELRTNAKNYSVEKFKEEFKKNIEYELKGQNVIS
jgi:glycosyltransferase involved in cell wall biosynthesis